MGVRNRLGLLVTAALAAGGAHAQQAPPAPAPAPEAGEETSEESEEIVVLAQPGDEVRIDRRTYTLRDDATAQSTNMFDVLGRIPSVSVSPAGDITLLGASGVTIQINGQPVPGASLEQVLRGLPGSNVERIEVITNPSAQYSAQASGGIINIITRQRFESGFSGNLQAGGDTFGGYNFGVAPNWSRGPWSLSGQLGVFRGVQQQDFARERRDIPSGDETTENGARENNWDGWYASRLQAGYSPNERRRLSLSLDLGDFNSEQRQGSQIADALGPVAERAFVNSTTGEHRQLTFDVQQQGDQPRELVKINARLSRFSNAARGLNSEDLAVAGGLTQYATLAAFDTMSGNFNLDVEQPFEGERFLTFGLAFDTQNADVDSALATIIGAGPADYQRELLGTQQTLAGYGTYQFVTGDWTWLPGLRAESYRREVVSSGLETDSEETRVFPSLHIRRELTSAINLDLSYTSRIQRPWFQQLDPGLRFVDVDRAVSGNPNLQPTSTDAFEANLVYQRDGANFSITAFDRISEDIVSQFTEVTPGGLIVTMPVNAGTSEQRGLQVLLRGPLGAHWRYSLSGNVLSREFDVLTSGGALQRRSEVEYDGVAQLDWRDPDQNAIGADQLQFELRFQGPRFGIQSESEPFVTANFTWRRRLSQRLFAVLTVQDIFSSSDYISQVTTADYVERSEFTSAGIRARLALTYQFGAGPQQPPPDQAPGGPPMQ